MEILGFVNFFHTFLLQPFYRIGSDTFFPQQAYLKKNHTFWSFFQFEESDVMQEVFLDEKVFSVVAI